MFFYEIILRCCLSCLYTELEPYNLLFVLVCLFILNPKPALHLCWVLVPSLYEWNGICPSVASSVRYLRFLLDWNICQHICLFLLVCLYLFSILPGRCGIYSCDEIVTGLAGDWIFIHESSLTSKALSNHRIRPHTTWSLEQINRLQSEADKQNVQNTARLYSIYCIHGNARLLL